MSTQNKTAIPNSLNEHWMPFTSNKDFKENPRLIVEAKGVYLKNHQGQTQIDASSGLFCNPLGHGREEIIEAIKPAGLYNAKSKNIIATSKMLLEKFNGVVPRTQKELMTLPGVGRKSSDIVMRFVFGEPHIAVDTHVFRMLWRLGWADSLDEGKASMTVNNTTPSKYKYGAHMWLITHAKKVCKSRSPVCDPCVISAACDKRDIDIPKSKLRQNLNT